MTDHHEPATRAGRSVADRAGTNDSAAMNQGMRVLSHLIAGVLLYGALGWLGDHYLSTRFLLPVGIVLGAALAVYATVRRLSVQLDPSPTRSERREVSTEQKGKGER